MAKRGNSGYNEASAMPSALPIKELDAVTQISEASFREPDHALALLEWLGDGLSVDQLNDAARLISSRLSNDEKAPLCLTLIEDLIGRGADPFAFKGAPSEGGYEPSAIEGVIKAKRWSYARHLASRLGETGWAQARSAMERIDKKDTWTPGPRSLSLASESGEPGVAFALACGRDPNETVSGQPWVFSAVDAPSLLLLAQAGADLRLKGKEGLSLEESLALRPAGKERQSMLDALAQASSIAPGQAKPSEGPAIKSLESLATNGVYAEMVKVASLAGVNLASIKTQKGDSLLALALLSANWGLAADLVAMGGASPVEPSRYPGIPVGALALWATPNKSKFEKSMAKRQDECFSLALGSLDYQSTDESGDRFFERANKARVESRESARFAPGRWRESAAIAALRSAPSEPENPLWLRLAKMGQSPSLIARAAIDRDEPWLVAGEGLVARLAVSARGAGGSGYYGDGALSIIIREVGSRRAQTLASPGQWALAFEALWELSAAEEKNSSEQGPGFGSYRRDSQAIRELAEIFGRLGASSAKEASERSRLACDLALDGWDPRRGVSEAWAGRLIESFCVSVISRDPKIAPALALEILSRATPEAARVADALLKALPALSQSLDVDAALFSNPPNEALLSSALWASVQERREAPKPIAPIPSTRRL